MASSSVKSAWPITRVLLSATSAYTAPASSGAGRRHVHPSGSADVIAPSEQPRPASTTDFVPR